MPTKIEWTEETWNPVIGCSHISPGCDHCYAERMAGRLANMVTPYMAVTKSRQDNERGIVVHEPKWNSKTHLVESTLEKPLHWKKPRTIFVCSMGDLFHESVPFEWIDKVFDTIMFSLDHAYLLLTKRPHIMKRYFESNRMWQKIAKTVPLPNIWLGVTAENQEQADKRIPVLLTIPAAKRFVSMEPMLGPINLSWLQYGVRNPQFHNIIDWVICGAETGPQRREARSCWYDSIIEQCKNASVPLFIKSIYRNNKKISMPEINGKIYNQKP